MEKQEILGLTNPAQCCGCGACAAACPVNAITMVAKDLGAYYPEVNTELCISCGKCRKVCIFQSEDKLQNMPLQTYAAANADPVQQKKSASGGVFAALAQQILAKGGVASGCAMETVDGILTPMHIAVERVEDLPKLQGSKYVQSKTVHCFPTVKKHLQKGRPVFFSGTPCQVAALKHYLGDKNTENLYTADLICHGTPGTELFRGYIAYLQKQKHGNITEFSFRDKSLGWGLMAGYGYQKKRGGKKHSLLNPRLSSYYTLFLGSEIYRESCYTCPWAQHARVGDVTLGDYWGVETEQPDCLTENGGKLSVKAGISVLLVNTPQGEELLDRYGDKLVLVSSELERAARQNRQLHSPSQHTALRKEYEACYAKDGYYGIEKLFRKKLGIRYYVRYVKSKIKEFRAKP